jgi:U3 small nucleolar RNA-associated protein 24
MGRAKKTRKFATVKRMIQQRDSRLKKNMTADDGSKDKKKDEVIREMYAHDK